MDFDQMVINVLIDYHTLKDFPKSGQNSDPSRDLDIKPAQLFSPFFDSTLTVNFDMNESLKKMLVAMVMKYKNPASNLTSLAAPHNANTTLKLYKQFLFFLNEIF
jgi:hypothetical protein